jgi:Flp pilus assembly protein TadD
MKRMIRCFAILTVLFSACASNGGKKSENVKSANYTFIRGMNLYQKNQKQDALNEYLQAYKKTPKNLPLIKEIALLYGEFGEYDRALEFFQKAEKLDKNDRNVLENLGYLYYRKKDMKKAAVYFQKIPNGSRVAIEKILREITENTEDDALYVLLTYLYLNVDELINAKNTFLLISDSYRVTRDYQELQTALQKRTDGI